VFGILPNVALCVYVGSLGRTSLTGVGVVALVLPAVGVCGSVLAIVLVGRAARRTLLRVAADDGRTAAAPSL
jgi:hypothetical protein